MAKKKIKNKNDWSTINIKLPTEISQEISGATIKRKPKKAEIIANLVCDKLGYENAFDIEMRL